MSQDTPKCPILSEILIERSYAQSQESARPGLAETYMAARMLLARMERRHVEKCVVCQAEEPGEAQRKSREAA